MKTKICPISFIDELEQMDKDESGVCHIGIDEMSITYIQPADTNSMTDDIQTLKLSSRTACATTLEDALADNDIYIDIEIPEGGHWSIDNEESLVAIVKDFKGRYHKGLEDVK